MQSTENWLPVTGYEDLYEVSDGGRVRSLDRLDRRGYVRPGRILKPGQRETGHLHVVLSRLGKIDRQYVHKLVLEAFVGARPDGLVACHGDGDPTRNVPSNLRWDTQRENVRDEVRHGTHGNVRKTHCPRSHPLVEPNLVRAQAKKGFRACLACQRAWAAAHNAGMPFDADVADAKYRKIMRAEHTVGAPL